MRIFRSILLVATISFLLTSCGFWNKIFKPKYGCPSNGKNVGAEKLLGGDPKAEKQARKAKKYKFDN
jgi:hypothetical protein